MADRHQKHSHHVPQLDPSRLKTYVVMKASPNSTSTNNNVNPQIEVIRHGSEKARVRKSSIVVLPTWIDERPISSSIQQTFCNPNEHPLNEKLPSFYESKMPAKHLIILKLNQCLSNPNILYYQQMINVKVDTLIEIYNFILEHNEILSKTILRRIYALFRVNCFRKTFNQTKFDPVQALNMLDPTDSVVQSPRLVETTNLLRPGVAPSSGPGLGCGGINNGTSSLSLSLASTPRSSSAPPGASQQCVVDAGLKRTPRQEADPPSPDWIHLKLVYEICYIALQSKYIDEDKFIKNYINEPFISECLELFESNIEEERLILKSLLHKLYSRFLSSRNIIRSAIYSYLDEIIASYQWEYIEYSSKIEMEREKERERERERSGINNNSRSNRNIKQLRMLNQTIFTNDYNYNSTVGIADILDFLSCIISGYTIPLKEEHINILKSTLFQLHKHPQLRIFYSKLLVCIKYYLLKSNDLINPILQNLIDLWPRNDTNKQLLFINEVREVLSLIRLELDNTELVNKLVAIVKMSLGSTSAKIIDETLNMFSDNAFINIISHYSHEMYPAILPNLVLNLKRLTDKQNTTYTLRLYKEMHDFDQLLFEGTMKNHKIFIDEQIRKKGRLEHFWEVVGDKAKMKAHTVLSSDVIRYISGISPDKYVDSNTIDWCDDVQYKIFLEHNTDCIAAVTQTAHTSKRRRRNTVSVMKKL